MRLLITGATGFAGNALLDLLPTAVECSRLTLLALPGDPGVPRVRAKGTRDLEIAEGDVIDERSVAAAMKGHSHVVHLAGLISYWGRDRERLARVNHVGARNVAEAAAQEGVTRLVHISTVGAIGYLPDAQPAGEDVPFNWPDSFHYMTTKHAGQAAVEQVAQEQGLDAVILNPGSLMGPGDPDPRSAHNRMYAAISSGPFFGCFAGGLAITDVRDLASVIVKALTGNATGGRYLVVGSNLTYVEVVRAIGQWFGRPVYPFRVPPFLLTTAGAAMELVSAFTHRKPLLTAAYGRLSGTYGYYSNAKSVAAFGHEYIPASKTIADGCAYYAATHSGRTKNA